mgnify:CR=1 FL=1
MKNNKKNIYMIIALVVLLSIPSIAYALTSAKLAFCDYGGVRRTFMIVGIIINIVKIVVPLIIVITGMIAFAKPIISGKTEDLTGNAMILFKKFIAGVAIFYLPTIINFALSLNPDYDKTSYYACTECMNNPDGCTIPTTDPETYTPDATS